MITYSKFTYKFPSYNVKCSTFNEQFMKQHHQQWCDCDEPSNKLCEDAKNSEICKNPELWLNKQRSNKLVRDPHQCESSCKEPGPDCIGKPSNEKISTSSISIQ